MLIAQITDTHVKADGKLAYRKVDTAGALRLCVDHLNALDPRPDVVLFTGDLADIGRPEEYELVAELIAPLAMPCYLVPGNHDDRANLRAAFPGHRYLHQDPDFLHYVIEDWPVRLIGLDTTIPGAKEGILCSRRLAWLEARLGEDPDRPTVLFMHHPPFVTGIAHMDVQNCGNAEALVELIGRHGQIARLLCGHVHRFVTVNLNGVPASIGPSPSHAVALDLRAEGPPAFVMEPPACQLLQMGPDGRFVGHMSYIGAYDGPYPFFDENGRLID